MGLTREDSYRHKGLRRQMVERLKEHGITDRNVLQAMMEIPRHFFIDNAFDAYAYEEQAFEIQAGQTMSRPLTVAFQSSLLEVKSMDKILEVGTGSTYQATILAHIGAQVFTIERQREIYEHNRMHYPYKNKYSNLKFFLEDGFAGLPSFAPFDKILVTAAAPYVPDALLQQLKVNGYLVIPLDSEDGKQKMLRIKKMGTNAFEEESFGDYSFVPMLSGKTR